MAGVKISALPAIATSPGTAPLLTDIFPEVQPASGGTTYKTTFQQLLTLYQANIVITDANFSGVLGLNHGGTNAALTASNGGIFYSTATAGAILSGTATAGKVLQSGATAAPTWSTPTYPSASGTVGKILISDGTNNVYSTPTYPNASATAGKVLISDGTNFISSTSLFPNTVGATGKILISNGTSNIYSTPTYPATSGTTGTILISDGTNNIYSTPAYPNLAGTAGKVVVSDGTNFITSTATFPITGGTAGSVVISDGTNKINSTSLWPNTVGSVGTILRSNGTSNAYTTSTFADTYGVNQLLYASSANIVAGLATANSGTLITSAGGIPSISSTLPSAVQTNITALGAQSQALNMNTHLINNVVDPVSLQDAATKNYVDTVAQGLNVVGAVRVGSTAPLTVTYANGAAGVGATLTNAGTQVALAIDDITLSVNYRVLIKNQTSTFQNGIYSVTDVGSGATNWVMTRTTDYDSITEITPGDLVLVSSGTTNAGTGWIETATVATIGTDPILFTLFSSVASASVDNFIYGGNFDTNPWQRGTTFTSPASVTYNADRFSWIAVGTGFVTITKTADAPTVSQAGIFTTNCLKTTVTTADAAMAAGDIYTLAYKMEGYDFSQLAQKSFTLSFWVKSTVTGVYSIGLTNSGVDRYYVAEYTISTTNTWQLVNLTIPASPSAGTWDYTYGVGINIYFIIASGSSFFGTVGTWTAGGNTPASANQVNGVGTNGNIFELQLVKVIPGAASSVWPVRSEQQELALCQRYYEKTFPMATAPAQSAGNTGALAYSGGIAGVSTAVVMWSFRSTKRILPTLTFYNPAAANAKWRNISIAADSGLGALVNSGESFVSTSNTQVVGDLLDSIFLVHITADAEL